MFKLCRRFVRMTVEEFPQLKGLKEVTTSFLGSMYGMKRPRAFTTLSSVLMGLNILRRVDGEQTLFEVDPRFLPPDSVWHTLKWRRNVIVVTSLKVSMHYYSASVFEVLRALPHRKVFYAQEVYPGDFRRIYDVLNVAAALKMIKRLRLDGYRTAKRLYLLEVPKWYTLKEAEPKDSPRRTSRRLKGKDTEHAPLKDKVGVRPYRPQKKPEQPSLGPIVFDLTLASAPLLLNLDELCASFSFA